MAINYEENNPFYNKVDPVVSDEIKRRASIYAAAARGTKEDQYIHNWIEGKTAYVKIYYGEGTNKKILLEPPKEGFDSVYGQYGYFPKPVVNSVRISNEGDFGSLLKAEINFSVFTLDQLTTLSSTLLTVKAGTDSKGNPTPVPVEIDFGWTLGGNGGAENFFGYVIDYSWTLRADGGFDCVSKLVGEGFFHINVDVTANDKKESTEKTANGTANSIHWIEKLQTSKFPDPGVSTAHGLAGMAKGKNFGIVKVPLTLKNEQSTKNESAAVQYDIKYVTLEFICLTINSTLNEIEPNIYPKNKEVYVCNSEVSKGWNYDKLLSSNPKNVLFPDFITYGKSKICDDITDIKMKTDNSKVLDLSKILVSGNFLRETVNSMKKEFTARMNFKDFDMSLSNFFKKIFDEIEKCSGGLYKLSLQNPVTSKNLTPQDAARTWLVMDTQFNSIEGIATDKNFPQIIPVVVSSPNTGTYSSIVRNVSLSSKLPGAMATAQFVSATTTLTGNPNVKINGVVTPKITDKDIKKANDDLDSAAESARTQGFASDYISKLETALSNYKKVAPDKYSYKQGFPIPVNLEITLDGIKGFRFGNTLKIDYLPKGYEDVVFTVTKIVHDIKNNDWTTTLSTVCRMKV